MDIRGGNLSGVAIIDRYKVPNAPILGTATADSWGTASVPFTAPFNGNQPITSYTLTVVSTGATFVLNQSNSGTFNVTGLMPKNSYTFTVYATNSVGNSSTATSNPITTPNSPPGQITFTTIGTTTWTVPEGVFYISMLTIGGGGAGAQQDDSQHGGGGGGGGGLAYVNTYATTPGTVLSVVVGKGGTPFGSQPSAGDGGTSSVSDASVIQLSGGGGGGGGYASTNGGSGGIGFAKSTAGTSRAAYSGGIGGNQTSVSPGGFGSGGGAAGYAGIGGNGFSNGGGGAVAGAGGGGGGGGYVNTASKVLSGGGVGILGQGSNGASGGTDTAGGGGSGGSTGGTTNSGTGGLYGGGGGGIKASATPPGTGSAGGQGVVRIIWPGDDRYYPTTRTTDE